MNIGNEFVTINTPRHDDTASCLSRLELSNRLVRHLLQVMTLDIASFIEKGLLHSEMEERRCEERGANSTTPHKFALKKKKTYESNGRAKCLGELASKSFLLFQEKGEGQ